MVCQAVGDEAPRQNISIAAAAGLPPLPPYSTPIPALSLHAAQRAHERQVCFAVRGISVVKPVNSSRVLAVERWIASSGYRQHLPPTSAPIARTAPHSFDSTTCAPSGLSFRTRGLRLNGERRRLPPSPFQNKLLPLLNCRLRCFASGEGPLTKRP